MRGNELLEKLVEIDDDLVMEAGEEFAKKKKSKSWTKWVAAAACICICLVGSIPVLATTGNSAAYDIMYSISPDFAQRLKPVNVSCTDKGIEMNVVGAEIDGDKANIMITMRDVERNRLDETTDIFDSFSINTPYDQSGTCSLLDFDKATGTATFYIAIEQNNNVLIPGDKITVSASRILSNKKHNNYIIEAIDTENADAINEITEFVKNPDIRGYGVVGTGTDESVDKKNAKLIATNESMQKNLEPGVTWCGYGFIDGKLHVQIKYDDILNTDNHGDIYLVDSTGEALTCESNISFCDKNKKDSYEEYIFSVSRDEICNYKVWGEFYTANEGPIEGDWEVTFPLTGAGN